MEALCQLSYSPECGVERYSSIRTDETRRDADAVYVLTEPLSRSDRPVDAGDVAVEALDVVEATGLVGEHVHHHVAVVDEHPLLLGDALDARRAAPELLAHLVLHLVGDRAHQPPVGGA